MTVFRAAAAALLALAALTLAPAAVSAAPHTAAHRCTWTIDWNWNAGTAPNWSQVDWETSNCGYTIQQGSWCATRTGTVLVKSGAVTAIELEARATCANTQRLVKCAYRINGGSWVTDCNPPAPVRANRS